MTRSNLEKIYSDRIDQFLQASEKLKVEERTFSYVRLALFVVLTVIIVWLANERAGAMIAFFTSVGLLFFGQMVKKHNKIRFELLKAQNLEQINKEELHRLKGTLHDLPAGEENIDVNHPYIPDLDVFGSNSLFQLVVRSRLSGTRDLIASWLKSPSSKEAIISRQEAISEIQGELDLQQEITALGIHKKNSKEGIDPIIQWLSEEPKHFTHPIWKVLQWIFPAFSCLFLVGWWLVDWPYHWIYLSVFVHLMIIGRLFKPLMEASKNMNGMTHSIGSYEKIIARIESKNYESALLSGLSQKFQTDGVKATKAIKKLRTILFNLESRMSMFYGLIDLVFCTDLIIHQQASQWKKKYGGHFKDWIDAVHEFDAIANLASYAFSNPDYCFPNISEEKFALKSEDLGHPLIKSSSRISNDFESMGAGSLALVTGSNMSGKSTFLRTIGVNLVLAQMGAPVCAKKFEFSLTQIYTSMRTQDNLEESVSSFYAELRRIRNLLDLVGEGSPVFYMLDEILKGTNSDDRHHGGVHLIKQLTDSNSMGLISTHDLQLSELAKNIKNISNYSFNNSIENDEIVFDYKLTPGPCKSFNASKLMEKMGIIKKEK